MTPQIEGAPNYRQADSLRVHGVAIPTAVGIRNVLRHIGAHKDGGQVKVLWISLREERVVYINGRPFVLRDVEKPFTNHVKISEKTSATRSTIIVPSSGISWFLDLFNYYVNSEEHELFSKELQLDSKVSFVYSGCF